MNLKTQPNVKPVGQNPFDQFSGIEQTVAGVALGTCVFAKGWGEQNISHTRFQPMFADKVASELIVPSIGDHELNFIVRSESFEILDAESAALS